MNEWIERAFSLPADAQTSCWRSAAEKKTTPTLLELPPSPAGKNKLEVQEGQQGSAATKASLVTEVAEITEGYGLETISSRNHLHLIYSGISPFTSSLYSNCPSH